jgi:thioredoxin reductase (NADPH)
MPEAVRVRTPEGERVLKNDFVFALTGYHPDYDFLRAMGIHLSDPEMRPECNPNTFESNVPGIYVAGVVVSGSRTSEIFIENGRFHGRKIAEDLARKMKPALGGEDAAEIETQPIITRTRWVNEE